MRTRQYLDAICARYQVSDYRAARLLGVTKQAVSGYRSGYRSFSDAAAIKAAQLLDLDPAEVLIDVQAERTKDENARRILEKVARALHRSAAAAVVVALPLLAGALLHGEGTPGGSTGAGASSVYYVKY